MRPNLRVLAGTFTLIVLAGIAVAQAPPKSPPPTAPSSQPIAISIDFATSQLYVADLQVESLPATNAVNLSTEKLQAAQLQLYKAAASASAVEQAQAVRRVAAFEAQQSASDGFKIIRKSYEGATSSAPYGQPMKQTYRQDSPSVDNRWNDGGAASQRDEIAQSKSSYDAASSHAEYARQLQLAKEQAVLLQAEKAAKVRELTIEPLPPLVPPDNDSADTVEVKRPIVYRAGKLPPGLPDWFVRLDTDSDGQVGLYEWKFSGRPLSEFAAMDRNSDGLVTVQEFIWQLAQQSRQGAGSPTFAAASPR